MDEDVVSHNESSLFCSRPHHDVVDHAVKWVLGVLCSETLPQVKENVRTVRHIGLLCKCDSQWMK